MLLTAVLIVYQLINFINSVFGNVQIVNPCVEKWTYDFHSGKCYFLLDGQFNKKDALDECRNIFPFKDHKDQISLAKIESSFDSLAIKKVMVKFNNKENVYLDAVQSSGNKYIWSDKSPVDVSGMKEWLTNVSIGSPCLQFKYGYKLNKNHEYVSTYIVETSDCNDKASVLCEHRNKQCKTDVIFDSEVMTINSNLFNINKRFHVACKPGYFRESELSGVPRPKSDLDIPKNYIFCTGTVDKSKNPYKFVTKVQLNADQRRVEECKSISCSPFEEKIRNVAKIKEPPVKKAYKFGTKYEVVCLKGYVNYANPKTVNSAMTCSQSLLDKRKGIWIPEDNTPCKPIKCNLTELLTLEPIRGKLQSAHNKISHRNYDVNFQRSLLPYFNNIITFRCLDGFFFPDRTWEKELICSLKEFSLIDGTWKGYLGTVMPLGKSCDPVTCKYEDIIIKPTMHLENYWQIMNSSGIWINQTEQDGEPQKFNTRFRFFCQDQYDTANQTPDQNLTCGPKGKWIPTLTACIKKTAKLDTGNKKRFVPPPLDAPAAEEVGYIALVILLVFLVLILILDLSTLTRDIKILRNNVKNLRNYFKKKPNIQESDKVK